MKGLTKVVTILAKILEVFAWVGCAGSAASLITIAAGKSVLLKYFSDITTSKDVSIGGFSIDMSLVDPSRMISAFAVFFVMAIILMALLGLIFRRVYLIFKTAEGKTKFSKGNTPFQPDIVRMIREIGILSLAAPVSQIIMSIIARIVIGPSVPDIAVNVDMTSIFFGLVILCLSQFFAYGAELQEQTEGLV